MYINNYGTPSWNQAPITLKFTLKCKYFQNIRMKGTVREINLSKN